MFTIIDARFPEASSQQKLVLLGILTMIACLQRRGEVVTVRAISQAIKADEPKISRLIKQLEAQGIVTKEPVANKHGWGKAYRISFADTPELRKAFGFEESL